MTNFPAAGYLGSGINNEQALQAQEDWLAATKQMLGGAPLGSALVIANGSITPTIGIHRVDTESGAATDNLDRIVTTNIPDGGLLLLSTVTFARTVILRADQGGDGQIGLDTPDFIMNSSGSRICLQRDGAVWRQIYRQFAPGSALWQSYLGLNVSSTYPVASSGEAAAGTATNRLMSPLAVAQAMADATLMIGNRTSASTVAQTDEVLAKTAAGLRRVPASALGVFSKSFESGELAIGDGTTSTMAHNLGGVPRLVQGFMRCKVAEGVWTVGEEILLDSTWHLDRRRIINIASTATNIRYLCMTEPEPITFADGTNAGNNNWKLVIRAWR